MALTADFIGAIHSERNRIRTVHHTLHSLSWAFRKVGNEGTAEKLDTLVQLLARADDGLGSAVDDQMTADFEVTKQSANETAKFMLAFIERETTAGKDTP